MTEETIHKLIRRLSHIRLSEGARSRMRERLISYTELHSVSGVARASKAATSPFASLFRSRALVGSFAAFVLVVGSSAGIASAADGALPGDALYAVKVSVNEPVAEALAATPVAKARVHALHAEKRVDEATKLAASGKLTPEVAKELSESFEKEADEVGKNADSVAASGDITVALSVREDLADAISTKTDALIAATATTTIDHVETLRRTFERKIAIISPERDGDDDDRNPTVNAVAIMKARALASDPDSDEARVLFGEEGPDLNAASANASTTASSTPENRVWSLPFIHNDETATTTATSTPKFFFKFGSFGKARP